ncbi:MAG: VTT domain-containing protein [Haloarculaceae archaeon]
MASDSRDAILGRGLSLPSRRVGLAVVATVVFALVVIAIVRADLFTIPAGTTEIVRGLLTDYGLPALFVVFVIEGAMLLYFAPSESLTPAAVVVLTDSTLEVAIVIAVAVVGATVGQVALFLVARRAGREYLLETRWLRIGEQRLDRFDAWFGRWGPLAVPASNTMLFTRGMLTIPAGLAEMDARTFAALSALGTLAFETILAALTLGTLNVLG